MAELGDGRVLLLLRTNWGRFWEALSEDGGRSWRTIRPTGIEASSSPGYLLRLASGRMCLAWNRPQAADGAPPVTRSGQYSQDEASWFRDELSVAFSEDEYPVVVGAAGRGHRQGAPTPMLSEDVRAQPRPHMDHRWKHEAQPE